MPTRVTIDGTINDETATVSVFDRGFLYGDGVYEVMRTYDGRPWAMPEHLGRLRRSAGLLGFDLPLTDAQLADEVTRTLADAGNAESYVRVIVTRGAGPLGLDPALAPAPCRVIIVTELRPIAPVLYERGIGVHLVETGASAAALAGGAKSGNYLPNILALGQAKRDGAEEALLLDAEGFILEGSSSNIFIVSDGVLSTPPLTGILEGITRGLIVELARQTGRELRETRVAPADLRGADEAFITSTLREVLPVTQVDGEPLGEGRPGPVTTALHEAYRRRIRAGNG